jgi:hypothetical protein
MAAAENVALLYEACWRYGGDAVEQYCGKDEDDADSEARAGTQDSAQTKSDVAEGTDEGDAVVSGGGSVRRVSKAERARERIVMRNALKTVGWRVFCSVAMHDISLWLDLCRVVLEIVCIHYFFVFY